MLRPKLRTLSNGFHARWARLIVTSRQYSILPAHSVEKVQVTCGSSGHITMKIHNSAASSTSPLVIHIPPISLANSSDPTTDIPVPSALLTLSIPIIQIFPRWSSPNHRFPTPIHDLLYAYNHLLAHILPQSIPPSPSHNHASTSPRPIAVYASHLSGTLATSFALTECRPHASPRPPATVAVLAVKDAPFDWSVIASTRPPSQAPSIPEEVREHEPASSSGVLNREDLYALRAKLFRDPAGAFDAFASPMLFFRTTGRAVPRAFPEVKVGMGEEMGSLMELEDREGSEVSRYVTRKSHLSFPPKRSGLRIPIARIGVSSSMDVGEKGLRIGRWRAKGKKAREGVDIGEDKGVKTDEDDSVGRNVLREQAEEMVKLMRRSVILHERKEKRGSGLDWVAEAERRVALVELGTLSEQADGEDDGKWAADFFQEVLSIEEIDLARG